ncbi:MAG: iron-containing alcohol dehydrogenase [Pseudomonadota bacterium]
MTPFDVQLPGRIVFGRGKAEPTVRALASSYQKPLIIHGRDPGRAAWLVALFPNAITTTCVHEPDVTDLQNALHTARDMTVDAVIAIGGGSVLDLGKAVAGLARTTQPLETYLEVVGQGAPIDADPLPFIAIPTTSGTGAEATRNAVIAVPTHKRKVSIRDPRMLADLALVDPALTDHCPRATTLASGLDAITQLIEPYVSTRANPFTDAIVRQALEPALSAIRVLATREERDARDAMAFASHISGIALAHAGLGAVHGLAGVIGGITGAPHGEISATLLAPTLSVNRAALKRENKPTSRLDETDDMLSRHFGDQNGADGFEKIGSWVRSVGIRPLSAMLKDAPDAAEIADMARVSSSMKANPVSLSTAELTEIMQRES